MKLVDKFLNETAMYYLVLRGLAGLAALSILFGFLNLLPFSGLQFIVTFGLLAVSCYFTNLLISKILKTPINRESSLITALILFFIMAPVKDLQDVEVTILAGIIAMLSKYVFAIHKKHIFNPAAISAVILGLLGFGNEIWWVGSAILLPFVLVMGLLIVRKVRKFSMVLTFIATALIAIAIFNPLEIVLQAFTSWPLIFFGTVMLTEPQTTPPHRKLQMIYGGLVGLLFGSQFAFGPVYSSPELALVIGNIFSFVVSPKEKLFLKLKTKTELAPGVWEFSFPGKLNFEPGQYMEWTLPEKKSDNRGNRRSFSIASSPEESEIKIAVRMAKEKGSTFKNALLNMNPGDQILAGGLSGDFVLPKDKNKKVVFIAGGIGITPFRSIVKSLADKKETRDITLFYSVADDKDLIYKDIFKSVKFIPINTTKQGFITEEMIKKEVPDFKDRTFYISGPPVMVDSYKALVKKLGVSSRNIITDFFSGY